MATVSIIIKKSERKADGTWRVYFQISHKSKTDWIATDAYVDKGQITKKHDIKDQDVLTDLEPKLTSFRKQIRVMDDVEFIDVKELKRRLTSKKFTSIDFIGFIRSYITDLETSGKTGSIQNYRSVLYALEDFVGAKSVDIKTVNKGFLSRYSTFLTNERIVERPGRSGTTVTTNLKGLTKYGLFKHLTNLRTLFNAARKRYNSGPHDLITHYPFEGFDIGKKPVSRKRVLSAADILEIAKYKAKQGSREELGRDMFMLSFYLCGMNSVDIYQLTEYKGEDRIEYNRSKTRDKRADSAFISIKVPEVAKPLLYKYAGNVKRRYSSHINFSRAINTGLSKITKGVTHYFARHSFATIARSAGCSLDDIAMALNHKNIEYEVTGIYIDADWSIIDRVQEKVLLAVQSIDEVGDEVFKIV